MKDWKIELEERMVAKKFLRVVTPQERKEIEFTAFYIQHSIDSGLIDNVIYIVRRLTVEHATDVAFYMTGIYGQGWQLVEYALLILIESKVQR